jgi:hypothetical protein
VKIMMCCCCCCYNVYVSISKPPVCEIVMSLSDTPICEIVMKSITDMQVCEIFYDPPFEHAGMRDSYGVSFVRVGI